MLQQTLCKYGEFKLEKPLDQWIEPIASKELPRWIWFWDAFQHCLYKNCGTHWERYIGDCNSGARGGNLVFQGVVGIPPHPLMFSLKAGHDRIKS